MISIARELNALKEVVEAIPGFRLEDFRLSPPASQEEIDFWEGEHQQLLPGSLKAFYTQTDGFRLVWTCSAAGEACRGELSLRPLRALQPFAWEGRWYVEPEEEGFPDRLLLSLKDEKLYSFCSPGEAVCHRGFPGLEAYYAFLLAGRGYLSWRSSGLHAEGWASAAADYWLNANRKLSIQAFELRDRFPECDLPGAPYPGINHLLIRQKALQSRPLSPKELQRIAREHLQFLESGGAGGRWRKLHINGLVVGLYEGAEGEEGKQATLEGRNAPEGFSPKELELAFSNFCGFYGPSASFEGACLAFSLFTDAVLTGTSFDRALLHNTDFSRSDLRGASFRQARIEGADFENCLLQSADFRGCLTEQACFRGTRLEDIVW